MVDSAATSEEGLASERAGAQPHVSQRPGKRASLDIAPVTGRSEE